HAEVCLDTIEDFLAALQFEHGLVEMRLIRIPKEQRTDNDRFVRFVVLNRKCGLLWIAFGREDMRRDDQPGCPLALALCPDGGEGIPLCAIPREGALHVESDCA